jgi:hypothetical protein
MAPARLHKGGRKPVQHSKRNRKRLPLCTSCELPVSAPYPESSRQWPPQRSALPEGWATSLLLTLKASHCTLWSGHGQRLFVPHKRNASDQALYCAGAVLKYSTGWSTTSRYNQTALLVRLGPGSHDSRFGRLPPRSKRSVTPLRCRRDICLCQKWMIRRPSGGLVQSSHWPSACLAKALVWSVYCGRAKCEARPTVTVVHLTVR